jgi:hypothetical protein
METTPITSTVRMEAGQPHQTVTRQMEPTMADPPHQMELKMQMIADLLHLMKQTMTGQPHQMTQRIQMTKMTTSQLLQMDPTMKMKVDQPHPTAEMTRTATDRLLRRERRDKIKEDAHILLVSRMIQMTVGRFHPTEIMIQMTVGRFHPTEIMIQMTVSQFHPTEIMIQMTVSQFHQMIKTRQTDKTMECYPHLTMQISAIFQL